jgi:hypothetical protein
MNRRRGSSGWIVAGLGLLLCICLLPYLISSVYSVASTLFQVDTVTRWLWGDWLSTLLDPNGMAYRLMVEAPVCCGGAVGLLLTVFGGLWLLNGRTEEEEEIGEALEAEEEACDAELPLEDDSLDEPISQDIDRATW